METVDIQAVESKLSDVTVTPVPMTPKAQNLSINSSKDKEVSSSATITLTPSASSPTNVKESNGNSSGSSGSSSSSQPGQSKYAQLLGVIEEMGREVRPTYAGSRSSAERLKRGIVHARILVRECLVETERSARQ